MKVIYNKILKTQLFWHMIQSKINTIKHKKQEKYLKNKTF